MQSLNIYLDIDGVILTSQGRATNHADDFIKIILQNYPDSTYWLTAHCWRGQNRTAEVLKPALKPGTFRLLKQVKPTDWGELKVDAIDFTKPFLWFDDNLSPEEAEVLKHHNALECHRQINLITDPHQLIDEILHLKSLA